MSEQTHINPKDSQEATEEPLSSSPKKDSVFLDQEFFTQTEAAMKRIRSIRLKRPTLSQKIARALAGGN